MRRRLICVAAWLLAGVGVALLLAATLHPGDSESDRSLDTKMTEAAARLADALEGFGTNIVQAVAP